MAADLDSNFMLAPSLEMYFVNKDTGLPLTNGKIYFFEDEARTIPKAVYQIVSATPGGPYTYVALPNPVTLSAVGTFQDNNNNDILPYYFPYEGTQEEPGNIQLYYIEVYDSENVLQFTREAWPNYSTANVTTDQDVTNFVPNGQFLLHNNVVASSANSYTAGKISQASTIIAQGGWSFDRPIGSTATDFVTFTRYPTTESPTGNPRYAVQILTAAAAADAYKDLRLKFPNVNTFASTTQKFNLYFEAESDGADINNCQIIVRKYYGAGGSAVTEDVKATFSLTTSVTRKNFNFVFGINDGKSISALDDDYVQVIVRLPGNAAQTARLTDFCLTVNDEAVEAYPTQTNAQQLAQSTAGWLPTPDHDGYDLYLPLRLTALGLQFDDSDIGKVNAAFYTTPNIGELYCDGSMYQTANYSSDGIPYGRLQSVLYNNTLKAPIFGTGYDFFASVLGSDNKLIISTNQTGSAVASAIGTTPFTMTTATTGSNYAMLGIANTTTGIFGWATVAGVALTAASVGTSGFSVVSSTRNLAGIKQTISMSGVLAAVGLAGLYFLFSSTTVNYYVWFKVDGVGADPAVGGRTGILVNLLSTQSAADVTKIIGGTLSGYQQTIVTTVAASAMAVSQYFTINTSTPTSYYVWYKIDGIGSDPAPGGTGIQVDIVAADTATQVASKTMIALNNKFFAVPDLRGWFLRGWDDSAGIDPAAAARAGLAGLGLNGGDHIGTLEIDEILAHTHTVFGGGTNSTFDYPYFRSSANNLSTDTSATGLSESRPVNINVAWMIKY